LRPRLAVSIGQGCPSRHPFSRYRLRQAQGNSHPPDRPQEHEHPAGSLTKAPLGFHALPHPHLNLRHMHGEECDIRTGNRGGAQEAKRQRCSSSVGLLALLGLHCIPGVCAVTRFASSCCFPGKGPVLPMENRGGSRSYRSPITVTHAGSSLMSISATGFLLARLTAIRTFRLGTTRYRLFVSLSMAMKPAVPPVGIESTCE